MERTVGVILAAGQGKRMKSGLAKVLHPVGGIAMIEHVLGALRGAGIGRVIVVVGPQGGDAVRDLLGDSVEYAVQEQPLGTGHALAQVRPLLGGDEDVVVLYGDTPLLTAQVLRDLVGRHRAAGTAATLLTVELGDPRGYGRIVRDGAGRLDRIVEEADATPEQQAVHEVNAGIYCFRAAAVCEALEHVRPANRQGEYYLVDVVPILRARGLPVEAVPAPDPALVIGINTRAEQTAAEAVLRRRAVERLWEAGVTVIDPETTYIDLRARIGRDTVIYPFTVIEGETEVGEGCRIGPGSYLSSSRLGDAVRVFYSVVEDSRLAADVSVGPYSHLRRGTTLESGVHVGNFAEIKNSLVGQGSKVPHHSYLGDARVGRGVNIGAGVVTVNYDGVEKKETVIGDNAFIGCNANLIAPVRVEDGGYVAAGSSVNKDVPSGALAIARARQEIKPDWAQRFLARRKGSPHQKGGPEAE